MKVVFRTDASLQIGTGHVMRCLTLAEALSAKGVECHFICRAHKGNLIEVIRGKGLITHSLPTVQDKKTSLTFRDPWVATRDILHHYWLGATQLQDIEACISILAVQQPDWLIVDHYALDVEWERALASFCCKLMVIDDLADRPHSCDLLLDQTFGRDSIDYQSLVPNSCHLLCGSQYALLGPDFSALRPYSLQRRAKPVLRELLISMGGIDKDNVTGQILKALSTHLLPADCRITVVMGEMAPWLDEVQTLARGMPRLTRVLVGITNMAQLMADSDLAIGAAGTTSWERCCLGLPTIMLVLAENQRKVAHELERSGGVKLIHLNEIGTNKFSELLFSVFNNSAELLDMSDCAARVVDGSGVYSVIRQIEGLGERF